jgi:hypothetical protein
MTTRTLYIPTATPYGVTLSNGASDYLTNIDWSTDTSLTDNILNRIVHGATLIRFTADIFMNGNIDQISSGTSQYMFAVNQQVTGLSVRVTGGRFLNVGGRANVLSDVPSFVLNEPYIEYDKWQRFSIEFDLANRTLKTITNGKVLDLSFDTYRTGALGSSLYQFSPFFCSRAGSTNGTPNALLPNSGYQLNIGGNNVATVGMSIRNFNLTTNIGSMTFPLDERIGGRFYCDEDPRFYLQHVNLQSRII